MQCDGYHGPGAPYFRAGAFSLSTISIFRIVGDILLTHLLTLFRKSDFAYLPKGSHSIRAPLLNMQGVGIRMPVWMSSLRCYKSARGSVCARYIFVCAVSVVVINLQYSINYFFAYTHLRSPLLA